MRHVEGQEAVLSSVHRPATPEELLAHTDWVRQLARHLLGRDHDADVDEIVQETYVRALRRPPHVGLPLRHWLGRVTRNLWRERHRRDTRRARREAYAFAPGALPTPEESAELAERQRVVFAAVLALPEPYRHTIFLHYFHELSATEIAEGSGEPVATVRSRLQRARALLREDLERRFGERDQDWRAALVPLAAWGDGPVGAPPGTRAPRPRAQWPTALAAALVVALAVLAVAPFVPLPEADGDRGASDVSGLDVSGALERQRVSAGGESDALGASAAPVPQPEAVPADTAGALPESPAHGSVRVVVAQPGSDLPPPYRVVVVPLVVTTLSLDHERPAPVPYELSEATCDIDLPGLFPERDDLEGALVQLDDPRFLFEEAYADSAGPGDPGVEATLTARLAFVVTGRVLDPVGRPVGGAKLLAGGTQLVTQLLTLPPYDCATSGADGVYHLRVPPQSSVRVLATAAGLDAGFSELRSLEAGGSATVDVQLGEGASIEGAVVVREGASPEGLSVSAHIERFVEPAYWSRTGTFVFERGRAMSNWVTTVTDADGRFRFDGLSDIDYELRIEPPSTAHHTVATVVRVVRPPDTDVRIDARQVPVVFVAQAEDGPAAGVRISVSLHRSGHLGSVTTDDRGRGVIEVPSGIVLDWSAQSAVHADQPSATMTVTGNGAVEPVPVWMGERRDATLGVRILHADGTPVRDAAIAAHPAESAPSYVHFHELSSVDGVLVLDGLVRGSHRVIVRVGKGLSDAREYWCDRELILSVPSNQEPPTLVLGRDIVRGGRVRVRLTGSDAETEHVRAAVLRDGVDVGVRWGSWSPVGMKACNPGVSRDQPHESVPALPPGSYELRVERLGSAPTTVTRAFVVTEGRVTDVTIDLSGR